MNTRTFIHATLFAVFIAAPLTVMAGPLRRRAPKAGPQFRQRHPVIAWSDLEQVDKTLVVALSAKAETQG